MTAQEQAPAAGGRDVHTVIFPVGARRSPTAGRPPSSTASWLSPAARSSTNPTPRS